MNIPIKFYPSPLPNAIFASPLYADLRNALLPILGDSAAQTAEQLLAACDPTGQFGGILTPLPNSPTTVLGFISRQLIDLAQTDGAISSHQEAEIIQVITRVSQIYNYPPFNLPEDQLGDQSPIIRWILRYGNTPLFPKFFRTLHNNVLIKAFLVIDGRQWDQGQLSTGVKNLTREFLSHVGIIPNEDLIKLDTLEALSKYLHDSVTQKKVGDETRRIYRKSLNLLLGIKQISPFVSHEPGKREKQSNLNNSLGTNSKSVNEPTGRDDGVDLPHGSKPDQTIPDQGTPSDETSDQLEDTQPDQTPFGIEAAQVEADLTETINASLENDEPTEEEIKEAAHQREKDGKKKKRSSPTNALPYILLHPRENTPGVIHDPEVVFMLEGLNKLEGITNERSARAKLILFDGLGCGWTDQLVRSSYQTAEPSPKNANNLTFILGSHNVLVKPRAMVGRPDALDPDQQTEEDFIANFNRYAEHFVMAKSVYPVRLSPTLTQINQSYLDYCQINRPILDQNMLQQGLQDLSSALKIYVPDADDVSASRLLLTHFARTNMFGMSPVSRYAVCGRGLRLDQMTLNYTLIDGERVCSNHWEFVHWLVKNLQQTWESLSPIYHWKIMPEELTLPPSQMSPEDSAELNYHTGSWSVPHPELVREMLDFSAVMSRRVDLHNFEIENWQTRRMAFDMGILMLLRDFDVDGFCLPHDPNSHFLSFVQRTKLRYRDDLAETFAYRIIPPVLRQRFFECQDLWAKGYTDGPLICLRDQNGNRLPFRLEAEIPYILALMGKPEAYIRPYGLRHYGCTLHHQFNFKWYFLMRKANHAGRGYDRFNELTGFDYRDYPDEDAKVTTQIATYLGITKD